MGEENHRTAAAAVPSLSLDGAWAMQPEGGRADDGDAAPWTTAPVAAGAEGWLAATVPGCWEKDGAPGTLTGPVRYRRDIDVSALALGAAGTRLWWEMDAVSYHCEAFAGGKALGTHTGLWDPFAFEVPPDACAGGRLALALRVEKPGGKRFPVRETMAGFLPYVWGTWGGPWQSMRLRTTGPAAVRSVFVTGRADGTVTAEAELDIAGARDVTVRFVLLGPDGRPVAQREEKAARSGAVRTAFTVPRFTEQMRWEPESPVLFTLVVTALVDGRESDARSRKVGFRDVSVEGERILLNGKPVYLRMPLSWGWYEETRAPNPSPEVFEEELRRVRALGFNGMKLCLWVPPPAYFEIADAMGMLLWVELPMWLPENTEFSRRQTPEEYRRIVRQVGDRPSVVAYTVGCEIGAGMDAAFLRELYDLVKARTGSPLVRDNSGSAECYGGPMPESADFHDFHLYCDLALVRPTFAAFHPAYRPRQPFLFGEFCDQDALRDLPGLIAARGGVPPWWSVDDPEHNPQGVRWEYNVVRQREIMKQNGLLTRLDELRESSRRQALLFRKLTLEHVRSQPHMGGYVITGLVDTPISTAGFFNDFGEARFTPEEFTPFNQDTVLFLEADRRREWTAGGDRPAYLDRFCAWSGASVRRHVGVSHFGREAGPCRVVWKVTHPDGATVAEGKMTRDRLAPGDVVLIDLFTFDAPAVTRPERFVVMLEMDLGRGTKVANAWPLWVFPKPAKAARRVGLYDPAGHLAKFGDAVGIAPVPLHAETGQPTDGQGDCPVVVATSWRSDLVGFARRGGRVIYVQPGPSEAVSGGGLPAPALPFWREAMRLFDPNPLWADLPHEGETSALFYGLASDAAFDLAAVRTALGPDAEITPALTRVDARTFATHGYLLTARVGQGLLLLTTLRPQGGLGDEPSGLTRNVAGAWLLRAWIDRLATT